MHPDPSKIPLHDIHLPEAVSWWPLAIGWWLLLLIIIMSVAGILWWRRRQRLRRWRTEALTVLRSIEQTYQQHNDDARLVNELSVWLRRVSISVFPRQQMAAVTGQRWLVTLDSVFTNPKTAPAWRFDSKLGGSLIALPYQRGGTQLDIDTNALLKLCKAWIKHLPQPQQNMPMTSIPAGQLSGGGA